LKATTLYKVELAARTTVFVGSDELRIHLTVEIDRNSCVDMP
jgi:hypothetical protein